MTAKNNIKLLGDLEEIFAQVDSWELLRDKTIFVTGGTGFFGIWLVESFLYANETLSLNAKILLLTRNKQGFLNKHPHLKNATEIDFIDGDVKSFNYPEITIDYIIHAATEASASLNESNPLEMLDTITVGTRRVLDLAVQKKVKGFLLTSSGAIYGKQLEDITHVKEDEGFYIDINNPANAYAEGKRIAELYSSVYYKQYNMPVKIARGFAFVGPFLPLDKHFAIGNFIENALNKNDIIIKGDGTPYRSYMYATDLTIWLWCILLKGKDNTPYNVGSDEAVTIKETAEAVIKAADSSIELKILGTYSGKPIERYVPNVDKAKQELNLKISTNLDSAIRKTMDYYND